MTQRIDREILEFFKTKPTFAQVEILDRHDKKQAIILIVVMGFYMLIAFALGYSAGA